MAGGLRLLLPLLLASLAAGAAIGGSAEAPSGRAEPGEGGPRAVGAPWAGGGRRATPALPRQVRGQPPSLRPAACSSPLSGFSRKSGDSRCRRGELPPSGAAPVPASPGVRGGLVRQRRRLRGRPASCSPSKASSPPEGHGRSPVSHTGGPSASVSPQIEFGECTVTCGIGIREVLLTSGCPGTETKCIVGVEECRTSADCGWGIPISDGLACVKIACIFMPPEYRFKYVWKMLIPNKTAHILPSDSSIMKVCRDTHSGTFQCETQEKGTTVASIKYTVYAKTETQTKKSKRIETEQSRRTTTKPEQSRTTTKLEQSMRSTTDAILVFSLVTGIIVTVGVIIPMIFMICYWGAALESPPAAAVLSPFALAMIQEVAESSLAEEEVHKSFQDLHNEQN
ncbi:sperm acrosome membrane-associated protein 1 [Larus michahellis]|uniref:sperm acrosome membrane-associated protein 1 n=1 Tax=Larus michahellis TaxID=119627 RepID=UPI003D9BDF78